jgi:hypothetical protein
MAGFVLETNATSSSTFPHPTDDPDEKLRGAFGRTDGDRLFAFLLWELPIDGRFEEGLQGVEPLTFIQCAGSADALTVELREPGESCRGYVLSTLGRASDETGPRDVAIDWICCGSSTRSCSTRCMTPSSTPTTASRPIMAGSRPGYDRCAASNATGRRR